MIRKWLYDKAGTLPCRMIKPNGLPYLERYLVCRRFGFTIYLHRFIAGDTEEHFHDHPWNAFSIVLCGSYQEEAVTGICLMGGIRRERNRVWLFNRIPAGCFHRVVSAKPETWTLLITGKRVKAWGFLDFYDHGDTKNNRLIYNNPYDQDGAEAWDGVPVGNHAGREMFS